MIIGMSKESCPPSHEHPPTTPTNALLNEQELADAIERERILTEQSTHHSPVPEGIAPEPQLPHAPDAQPSPVESAPAPYRIQLTDTTIEYGRSLETLQEKTAVIYKEMGVWWMPKRIKVGRLRERIARKEIVAHVTPEGAVRIIDGNTTLYAALQYGIDPSELQVSYTMASRWQDSGPEYRHETLASLIEKVAALGQGTANNASYTGTPFTPVGG